MTQTPKSSNRQLRLFWYLAYTYFQNEHPINALFAKLKATLSGVENLLYKKTWETLEIRNPIFIVGPHRTGTTILQQMLCLHSTIATPRTYSDVFDMAPILSRKFLKILLRERYERNVDRIIVAFDSPQEAQGFISRYFNKTVVYNPTNEDDIKNYMKKLLYLENKNRFLWKVPYITIRIPQIVSLFPDAHFVFLHRDPLTCINSKLKFIHIWQESARTPSLIYRHLVGKHDKFDQDGMGYFMEQANRTVNLRETLPDPIMIAKNHLDWIDKGLEDLSRTGASTARCFLDFSTLILDPKKSLTRLFQFLGLPDESDSIISKLDNLGMPITRPQANLKYIPSVSISIIDEMCKTRMNRIIKDIDWRGWELIGNPS